MKVTETELPGVLLLEPQVFSDDRGWFLETWSVQRYAEAGLSGTFVQDNVSFSHKGTVRGLHFQYPQSQGKLIQILVGEVFDVAVDIRIGSPAFGKWTAGTLSVANHRQLYIPPGFAHGFCVLSETAVFSYKCTEYYNAAYDCGIIWNDPDINIDWPISEPVFSPKDAGLAKLKDIPAERLPQFEAER